MNQTQDKGDAPDALTEMRSALIEAAAALATVANNIRREDNGATPVLASIRLRVVDSGKASISRAADRSRAERCERW